MADPMIPAPPQTKGEKTRAALLEAAHALFLQHGYHGTSMRQIARHAGLTLSGIYNHYDGKEAIFVAVLMAHHPYHALIPALLDASGDSAEVYFRDAAERMVKGLQANPQFINLLLIEVVEFEARHIPQIAGQIFPQLFGVFQKSQRYAHELRPIPLPVMMRTFLGLFFSYTITEMFLSKTPLAELDIDWFGGMVDAFLHGIVWPEAENPSPAPEMPAHSAGHASATPPPEDRS